MTEPRTEGPTPGATPEAEPRAERTAREQGLEPEGGLSLSEREYIALEPVSEQDLES